MPTPAETSPPQVMPRVRVVVVLGCYEAFSCLRESITRRYDELTRSLDEELGLEPARETRVMYRQLLGQT